MVLSEYYVITRFLEFAIQKGTYVVQNKMNYKENSTIPFFWRVMIPISNQPTITYYQNIILDVVNVILSSANITNDCTIIINHCHI